jgi:hypothetical protein
MASCVTLLQNRFSRFLLRIYKHKNGMTFSPDLELKNSFCSALIFQEMAEKFGKVKSKTMCMVRNKVLTLFTLQVSKTQYSGLNTIQHNENITYIYQNK